MSEANGVGTLALHRVSTRGVFMFMGSSDTFLVIFMLILAFICVVMLLLSCLVVV